MAAFEFDATASQEEYSAESVVAELDRDSALEAERKADADAAGVSEARFQGYAQVLGVYEARTDVESLADRRARHYGDTFAEQDFARAEGYKGGN